MSENKSLSTQSQSLANPENSSLGLQGFVGFDASSMPTPFLRLVQDNTKSDKREDEKGTRTDSGTLLHSITKKAYKELEVVVIAAYKGKQYDERKNETYDQVKVLCSDIESQEPFLIYLKKASIAPFNRIILSLKTQKVTDPSQKIIRVYSNTYKNQSGEQHEYFVFGFDVLRDTPKELLERANELKSIYNTSIFTQNEEDEHVETVEEVKRDEEVTPDDIPFQ